MTAAAIANKTSFIRKDLPHTAEISFSPDSRIQQILRMSREILRNESAGGK
jgi:hypothetical protein